VLLGGVARCDRVGCTKAERIEVGDAAARLRAAGWWVEPQAKNPLLLCPPCALEDP
jgi:hypothetical protein